jgi:hypothetical protein
MLEMLHLALVLATAAVPVGEAAAPAPSPAAARPACPPELFRIGRNKNANEVVYRARLNAAGVLDPDDPIEAEWHMLAEDGHREGLNFIEKLLAYGFSVAPAEGGDGFVVVLKAKKDRPVRLTMRDGCPFASSTVAGKRVQLRRIFVQAEAGGGLIPEVAWADLEGVDPDSGATITERIVPEPE